MARKQSVTRYSAASKAFHWMVALVVILMLSVSFFLADLPERLQGVGYMLHKSIGITILCLMVMRAGWIYHTGKPDLPPAVPRWERYFSRMVQYSLYVLLIAMPLCGWILSIAENRVPSWFGLFAMPLPIAPNENLASIMDQAHKTIAWILIVLITLHIAGALKHHFFNKDEVLVRMLPKKTSS